MVDPQMIEAVNNSVRPKSLMEVKSLLAFASYYHQFVKYLASISTHLTNVTKKKVPLEWAEKCEDNLQKLKTLLTTTRI